MTPLEKSIAHWERMAKGERKNNELPSSRFCSLCNHHRTHDYDEVTCNKCPVKLKTGYDSCAETPYVKAYRAYFDYGIGSPEFKEKAWKEVEFLKSLLPTAPR